MSSFAARYRGACAAECGVTILPGDEVVYADDELMHVECPPSSDAEIGVKPKNVCQHCWLVHPGEC